MLKNGNIICISSIDWDFIWQGHQEIMSTFAKNGNRVLFIENTGVRAPNFKDIPRLKKRIVNWLKGVKGFRKETENLYVYSPVSFPFPYSRVAQWINRRMLIRPLKNWLKIMEFYDCIVWTFLPTATALDIIDNVDKKILVYYCIADFYELASNYRKVKRTEDALIRKCNIIFAQGKALEEKCKRLNTNVHIFPFGVSIEAFEKFNYDPEKVPLDIKHIKKPIVGYIGGIHKHIDFDLLKFIAQAHPEWSIVLVGPEQTSTYHIRDLKNIFFLGKKEFYALPYYINEFDVGIIPYRKTEYTTTVYPTKLNEYHALGKPVVSTDLPEVIRFNKANDNLVFIARTYPEFVDSISRVLKNKDITLKEKCIRSAKENSWSRRIEEMSNLIEKTIETKLKALIDWRKKFLDLYKVARTKILRLAFTILSIYLLVFYTPLIWFVATPLRISQMPAKADCIVVFAGGVGESGKAGEGYEERVQYAVELYRRDYAKRMIFSSGYTYVFKEPLIMKALVVSLGVPEEVIFLEDKAKNTYENVTFSKEILEKNNWNEILLVSSPYHIRRVALIFNKIDKGIKVIYTPIPNSLFYAHPEKDSYGRKIWKRINLRQIRGILHEYLGILYYWWKGWI